MVRRPQKRPVGLVVYIVRLLILGIGIGALAGTLLSALDPTSQASVKTQDTAKTQVQESPSRAKTSTSVPLTGEIPALKAKVQALAAQNPTLQPGVFIIELDTGAYVDLNSGSSFAAASTIKLPILVAFFRDVDAGKIRLDELLTLKPEMIASGSGDLQYKQAGTKYTALEVATKMIAISDNTATNMLIARLGGAEVLSERFRSWGLTATALRNQLPDVEGTNTTNPKELANLMSIVNQGELVSLGSRDRILDIMQRNEIDTLLPKGLGTGATIAHKTGNIGSLLADVGLVDMPTGKRYIIAVMVKRPFNDNSAQELIRQISRTVYDYFNQPRATPNTTSLPFGKTATYSRAIASETPGN
jgi:beta-lactamase class A